MQVINTFQAGGLEAGHIMSLWTQWLEMGGRESLLQGQILKVVQERALRGFLLCRLS